MLLALDHASVVSLELQMEQGFLWESSLQGSYQSFVRCIMEAFFTTCASQKSGPCWGRRMAFVTLCGNQELHHSGRKEDGMQGQTTSQRTAEAKLTLPQGSHRTSTILAPEFLLAQVTKQCLHDPWLDPEGFQPLKRDLGSVASADSDECVRLFTRPGVVWA